MAIESDSDNLGHQVLTRRTLIKAGVATGGAVWVAPAVESFTSRAAAGSVPTTNSPAFGCSWAYIVWKYNGPDTGLGVEPALKNGNLYYTGWSGDGPPTACGSNSSYPDTGSGNKPAVTTNPACSGTTFTIHPTGNPPEISYSGTLTGTLTTPTDACSFFTYTGQYGRTVQAGSNIEILAVFAFGAGSVTATCPNETGNGNSIDIICGGQ